MLNRYYMLVSQGRPLRITMTQGSYEYLAWPVTKSHWDAKRLAERLGMSGLRPALIGSVQGESFDQHVVSAAMEGCEAICLISGWNENTPIWSLLPLHAGEDDNLNPVAQNEEAWFQVTPLAR